MGPTIPPNAGNNELFFSLSLRKRDKNTSLYFVCKVMFEKHNKNKTQAGFSLFSLICSKTFIFCLFILLIENTVSLLFSHC